MIGIAPHVRLALLGEDLVVFDLAQDRYLALPGACTVAPMQEPAATISRIDPDAIEALVNAGILITGSEDRALPIRPPLRAMLADERAIGPDDFAALLIALARVGWRLRRGRHVRRFAKDRLAWCPLRDEATLRTSLGRLQRLRLFVPTPRRCLPRALTTALFLRHFDLTVDLVFGVRAHPFDAHCWLEWNGMLLDDDLDRVRIYAPIAIGRP